MIDTQYLHSELKRLHLNIDKEKIIKIDEFIKILMDKNKSINLTRIEDPKEIADKHIIDSIMPLKLIEIEEGKSLVDIGAGGGFPSVPLAIIRDDLEIVAIEASKKKSDFIKQTAEQMCIKNITVLNGRAEELASEKRYRDKFNYAIARAVGRLNLLTEITIPFLKRKGKFIVMKGDIIQEEIKKADGIIREIGSEMQEVIKYKLPNNNKRSIIILKKISQTPSKYPRKYSKILNSPIK